MNFLRKWCQGRVSDVNEEKLITVTEDLQNEGFDCFGVTCDEDIFIF